MVRPVIAASSSISTTGAPINSGSITFTTQKCFSLRVGSTAVHLLNKSFLG